MGSNEISSKTDKEFADYYMKECMNEYKKVENTVKQICDDRKEMEVCLHIYYKLACKIRSTDKLAWQLRSFWRKQHSKILFFQYIFQIDSLDERRRFCMHKQ